MEDGQWVALAGLVILALLVWWRIKHPTPYPQQMTEEEEQDWMDDLLFPPYSCWDNSDDKED